MKRIYVLFAVLVISLLALNACSPLEGIIPAADSLVQLSSDNPQEEAKGGSNSNGDQLDYEMVFPQDEVNEITISISPDNWQAMMDDMTELYGEQGTGTGFGRADRPGQRPLEGDRPAFPEGDQPQEGDQPAFPEGVRPPGAPLGRQPGEGGPGAGILGGNDDHNPIWTEAEFSFNGNSWEHIGIRFKGNSSLKTTWSSGSLKLPFKLDFDQFEDQYPATEDQRFYGFKQLSFSSNFHDDSYLHEKIAADLFREAGVPSAQTAFYAVSIDYGEGPVYLGVYTAVEVVDDTLIETQFSDDSGNVYKPEGAGATFAAGSFSEASFDKETNQEEEDYSDIQALFDALHAETRTTDPEAWREGLEAVFDVDNFLNWLAVNTVIQNWDTYGVMNHNYYLYNNPDTDQLVWIPWDNNEALKSAGGMRNSLPLNLSGVGKNWPLISYLRDDPVYYQIYLSYLESFITKVFIPDAMDERYHYWHDLIAPHVAAELEGESSQASPAGFTRSVSDLIQHMIDRVKLTEAFLTSSLGG